MINNKAFCFHKITRTLKVVNLGKWTTRKRDENNMHSLVFAYFRVDWFEKISNNLKSTLKGSEKDKQK